MHDPLRNGTFYYKSIMATCWLPAAREIAVKYFNRLKLDVEIIELRSLPVVMATHMLCSLQQ